MRNLKKILALVLALVMSLSLVTMASADYADQADIDNAEAVAVLSALEVLEGSDGKFNPDGILTREQAAKIITYMLLGAEKADKLTTVIAPFADVEATRWSAGAIAYCADQGILAGVGNGNFAPTAKLTGLQFAKMLLCALGYDSNIEGLTGDSWAIKVATLAIELGLDKGIVADLSAEMSRENAAQMALNALQTKMVKYAGGTTVELPGGTKVVVGATKYDVDGNAAKHFDKTATADSDMQFVEKYFPTLIKMAGDADAFGRPASYKWYLDVDKNGSYNSTKDTLVYNAAKTADYTVVLEKAYTADEAGLTALVADVKKATGVEDMNATAAIDAGKVDVNGVAAANKAAVVTAMTAAAKKGTTLELYMNEDGVTVDEIVVYYYTLVKVADVTDLTAAQIKNLTGDDKGSTKEIDLAVAGGTTITNMKDARFAGFNYAKDEYVLAVLKNTTDVLDAKAATTVEGKVDATKSSEYRLNGAFYAVAGSKIGTVATPAIGTEGKWVLDAEGKLAAEIDVSTKAGDYAYVYKVIYKATDVDASGYTTTSATVYAVLADGTIASYPAALDGNFIKGDKVNSVLTSVEDNAITPAVVAYSIVDGKFEVAASANKVVATANTEDVNKADAMITSTESPAVNYFVTDATNFVFAKDESTKMSTSTAVGYKNVAIADKAIIAVVDATSKNVLYAFVADANAFAASEDAVYAVLMEAAPVVTGAGTDADPTKYTYSITVDGAASELVLTAAQNTTFTAASLTAGDIFSYSFSNGTLSVTEYATTQNVVYVNGNQVQLSSDGTVDISEAAVYTVSYDKKAVTSGGALVAESGKDGNTVICISTDTDAAYEYIFIINEVNPEA